MLHVYTDGACSGNPGPGGWAYVIVDPEDGRNYYDYGPENDTTNNRMELLAVIKALEITDSTAELIVYIDSMYVKSGITTWIKSWKNNGWKTANRKPVKNQDLWMQLDGLVSDRCIAWQWVKGHSGNKWNEKVDSLAQAAIQMRK